MISGKFYNGVVLGTPLKVTLSPVGPEKRSKIPLMITQFGENQRTFEHSGDNGITSFSKELNGNKFISSPHKVSGQCAVEEEKSYNFIVSKRLFLSFNRIVELFTPEEPMALNCISLMGAHIDEMKKKWSTWEQYETEAITFSAYRDLARQHDRDSKEEQKYILSLCTDISFRMRAGVLARVRSIATISSNLKSEFLDFSEAILLVNKGAGNRELGEEKRFREIEKQVNQWLVITHPDKVMSRFSEVDLPPESEYVLKHMVGMFYEMKKTLNFIQKKDETKKSQVGNTQKEDAPVKKYAAYTKVINAGLFVVALGSAFLYGLIALFSAKRAQ